MTQLECTSRNDAYCTSYRNRQVSNPHKTQATNQPQQQHREVGPDAVVAGVCDDNGVLVGEGAVQQIHTAWCVQQGTAAVTCKVTA